MDLSKDLLRWLILKEKIKDLNQQRKWTGDSLTALRRTQEDYGNIPTSEFNKLCKNAKQNLVEIGVDLKKLREKLRFLEKGIMEGS